MLMCLCIFVPDLLRMVESEHVVLAQDDSGACS